MRFPQTRTTHSARQDCALVAPLQPDTPSAPPRPAPDSPRFVPIEFPSPFSSSRPPSWCVATFPVAFLHSLYALLLALHHPWPFLSLALASSSSPPLVVSESHPSSLTQYGNYLGISSGRGRGGGTSGSGSGGPGGNKYGKTAPASASTRSAPPSPSLPFLLLETDGLVSTATQVPEVQSARSLELRLQEPEGVQGSTDEDSDPQEPEAADQVD